MADIYVVAGAQYGSEAKGAVTAKIASSFTEADTVIRVAGPNAGHTAYDEAGREWKLRTVPVGAVSVGLPYLHIAAGSEVDIEVLVREIKELEQAGHVIAPRLTVHPSATILEPRHHTIEGESGLVGRVGSTGKGIGAARADRLMRRAITFGEYAKHHDWAEDLLSEDGPFDLTNVDRVAIEGTQGYGLGLHHRNYPQVTSSDCRAIDFLAMAGISPWGPQVDSLSIYLVARCFPIRVAGNSGPMLEETSWAELGLPEERTTVTNNVRRVGGWDPELVAEAIVANGGGSIDGPVKLAITMLDQMFPETRGVTKWGDLTLSSRLWLERVERYTSTPIELVGTSPTTMAVR